MTTTSTSQCENGAQPISERRLAANRANAQKSCGPKTAEGKERSRRNAVKHGLAAQLIDAPGLDPEVVQKRTDAWMKELNPKGEEVGGYLVEVAVRASFRLEGCVLAQKQIIAAAKRELLEGSSDEVEVDDRNTPGEQIKLFMRYELQAERTLTRLVKDLRARAKTAQGEKVRPQPVSAPSQPASARNEPTEVKPAPAEVDLGRPSSSFVDVFATPAKPAHPPQTKHERRKAKRYQSRQTS